MILIDNLTTACASSVNGKGVVSFYATSTNNPQEEYPGGPVGPSRLDVNLTGPRATGSSQDVQSGYFFFEDLPDGQYTVSVLDHSGEEKTFTFSIGCGTGGDGGSNPAEPGEGSDGLTIRGFKQTCAAGGGEVRFDYTTSNSGATNLQAKFYKNGVGLLNSDSALPGTARPFSRTGLTNGDYYVIIQDNTGRTYQKNFTVDCTVAPVCDLRIDRVEYKYEGGLKAKLFYYTTAGDGQIQRQVASAPALDAPFVGSDDYSLTVPAGQSFTVYVRDRKGCEASRMFTAPTVGCTDPDADNYDEDALLDNGSCVFTPLVKNPHFFIPLPVSLRFTQPGRNIAFDNTPFSQEKPLNFYNPGYCQKIQQNDTLVIQWQSNYDGDHTCELRSCATNELIQSFTPSKVVEGAGVQQSFGAYLRKDTDSSKSRVYFNSDSLPLPFRVNNRITLTGTSVDGTYPILSILEDPDAAVPYLLLGKSYPAGTQRINATVTTTFVVQAFDTWQAVLSFSGVSEGCYYLKLTAQDAVLPSISAVSEPIDVAVRHANTVVVKYRNFDNAFRANYTAGLVNRIRVVGRFFKRVPTTEKDLFRQSDASADLLKSDLYRRVQLDVYALPDWLHEKLVLAFCHDFVTVNGVEVVSSEAYQIEEADRYALSNGSITVEIKNGVGVGNRDDLGDTLVEENELLLVSDENILGI